MNSNDVINHLLLAVIINHDSHLILEHLLSTPTIRRDERPDRGCSVVFPSLNKLDLSSGYVRLNGDTKLVEICEG